MTIQVSTAYSPMMIILFFFVVSNLFLLVWIICSDKEMRALNKKIEVIQAELNLITKKTNERREQ